MRARSRCGSSSRAFCGSRPGRAIRPALDFHWMTGGENQPGSWVLKTEKLNAGQAAARSIPTSRFPSVPPQFPGRRHRRQDHAQRQAGLARQGWQYVPNATVTRAVRCSAGRGRRRQAGVPGQHARQHRLRHHRLRPDDRLRRRRDPRRLAGVQRQAGPERLAIPVPRGRPVRRPGLLPRLQAVAQGKGQRHRHAVCRPGRPASRRGPGRRAGVDRAQGGPGADHRLGLQHRQRHGADGGYGFRMGTSTYAPWYALLARDTHEGLVIGWDYFGHWASSFRQGAGRRGDGPVEGRRPQADARPGPIAHHAQGVRRPVPRRSGRRRQRGARLAIPLSLGLHPRGLVPRDPHARLLVQRHRLGAVGRGLDRRRARPARAPSARSSAWPT